MELLALDKNFVIIDHIVPTNIQWDRMYYQCGTFSLTIPANQYNKEMKYIYTKDRKETGVLNKEEFITNSNGKTIQLTGYFIEKLLDDKIAYPVFNGSGEITSVLTSYVNKYKEDLPIRSISSLATGTKIDLQDTGTELSKKLYETLETQEMSYQLIYDFQANKFDLKFYRGLDRTQSQTKNNFITFSTTWNNINEINSNIDDSNEKNYFVIGGSGEGSQRIYEILDLSNGGYKRKMFIDARDLTYNASEQTLAQYKLELKQRGLEKALEYKKIENISFKPIIRKDSGYEYLIDFDLGDKCSVILEDIGVELEIRITAIHEVFKDNHHSIEIECGNQTIIRRFIR